MVFLNCQLLPPRNPLLEIGNLRSITETGAQQPEKTSTGFKRVCEAQSFREAFEPLCNHTKPITTIQHYSYGPLLKLCTRERNLELGLQLHAHMIKTGVESDNFLQSNLLSLYIKCECMDLARRVFDTGNVRTSLISWNSMITLYSQLGLIKEALWMFAELQRYELQPDEFTLSTVISAMEQRHELSLGMQAHSLAIKLGYGEEEFVCNSLIQMYATCERINDSFQAFDAVSKTLSPIAWNSMIARLAESGAYRDGLELYIEMQAVGIGPTPLTFSSLIQSCANLESVSIGKQVHAQVIVHGYSSNVILETILLDLYFKFGELQAGRQVFDKMEKRNVVTWNSIIKGYSQVGCSEEALKLFRAMQREGIAPDKFTFPALLAGLDDVRNSSSIELEAIHAFVIKVGLETNQFVQASLIAMCSRSLSLEEARLLFDDMHSNDPGVWSSIIAACMKNREGEEALRLFTEMLYLDIKPNQFIYSSVFMACSELSMLETGKQIHAHSLRSSSSLDVATKNSLLTMYSNCGYLGEARKIFNSIENPNVISFNSVILALAQHGSPWQAAELYTRMKLNGLQPDEITVLNLLSAFNHAGLVNEGLELFNSMEEKEGIKPRYQHYACIVGMLARAGEIEEAVTIINNMPFKAEPSLWQVILGACSKHRNMEIGREVAEMLIELQPDEATNYVLLGNVYARVGRWAESDTIRRMMRERGIEKQEGKSWIEINRRIHTFGVEDCCHPLSQETYKKLRELIAEIKMFGYVPDISFTLHDIEDGRREESLYYHSEKLAFAFGVLVTPRGVTLRIMKNLRVCGDCHSAFKCFSVVTGKEIILRDSCRFHHFKDGLCSCGDYW